MVEIVLWAEKIDLDRIRSKIRSQMPYPLGHRTFSDPYIFEWIVDLNCDLNGLLQPLL